MPKAFERLLAIAIGLGGSVGSIVLLTVLFAPRLSGFAAIFGGWELSDRVRAAWRDDPPFAGVSGWSRGGSRAPFRRGFEGEYCVTFGWEEGRREITGASMRHLLRDFVRDGGCEIVALESTLGTVEEGRTLIDSFALTYEDGPTRGVVRATLSSRPDPIMPPFQNVLELSVSESGALLLPPRQKSD